MKVGLEERRIRCMSTSVSELEWKIAPSSSSLRTQRHAVGEVSVVSQRHVAVVEPEDERLDVVGGARSGGGITHVADRLVAGEPSDLALVAEHLGQQSEAAVSDEMAVVVGDDAGAFLTAVLQCGGVRNTSGGRRPGDPIRRRCRILRECLRVQLTSQSSFQNMGDRGFATYPQYQSAATSALGGVADGPHGRRHTIEHMSHNDCTLKRKRERGW